MECFMSSHIIQVFVVDEYETQTKRGLPFSALHSRRASTRFQLWHCMMLQKVWPNKIETLASSGLSWTPAIVWRVTSHRGPVSVRWCCFCFGNTWWRQGSILLHWKYINIIASYYNRYSVLEIIWNREW